MAQGSQPKFKSEVFVPIRKDVKTFEERQKDIFDDLHRDSFFDDMHQRMQERRREWESEVERLRRDFFRLKPLEERRDSSDDVLSKMQLNSLFYDSPKKETGGGGDKTFRVTFDVSQFLPEEISVRTEGSKVVVQAKHEEKGGGKSESREFSRSLDIPRHIQPESLNCTLSKDGILQLEAPVSAPQYKQIASSEKFQHPAPLYSSSPVPGPLARTEDTASGFRMSVDIGKDFQPGDINVKTVDRKLIVHARHEEKSPGRSSVREFSREFELPNNVDPQKVTASMTEDGRLNLEAPYEGKQLAQQAATTIHLSR